MNDHRSHDEKIIDQHTRQAESYARLTGSMAGQKRQPRHEILGAKAEDKVLDIACGPGSLTLELAPHVAHATGLDLTSAMLDQARDAQARQGADNVVWVEGNAAALPFEDGRFTLVTCSAAFHHFENPGKVLAEMVRVCAHGGRVAVMDVTPDAGKVDAYDRMEKMRDPSHGHAHSLPELAAMGKPFGLAEPATHTSETGPLPYEAVLATSHPEQYSREELLQLMREDALSGDNRLGFKAQLAEDNVMVTYSMSTVVWTV